MSKPMERSDGEAELARLLQVPDVVLNFARAMFEADGENFEWLDFLEKPWKWGREYARWCDAGKPADLDGADFARFVASLEDWPASLR